MTNNEIKTTEAELLNNYLDSIPSCDRKYFAREVVRRCGNGITMKMENPGGGDHVTRVRLTPWPFLGLTIDN